MSEKREQKSPVSFDVVVQALADWRANKGDSGRGIPDDIWSQIFALESDACSASRLRSFFDLNSVQYKKKHTQLIPEPKAASAQPPLVDPPPAAEPFVEISVENENIPPLTRHAETTKATIKAIKSTKTEPEDVLVPSAVIVECIRSDGHRLKIHTTNQSIDAIIHSFCNQAVAV